MSLPKKFGKVILITLCLTTILFIYKSGFEEDDCDLIYRGLTNNKRNLITKEQKDVICTSLALKNLAGSGVQNALDFLTSQSNKILSNNTVSFLGITEDHASVVYNNIILRNY